MAETLTPAATPVPLFPSFDDWVLATPVRKIRVYGASTLPHASLWRDLSRRWIDEVEFTARWSYMHFGNIPETAEFARLFWLHDMEDVRRSDVVMVYAEPKDSLRGALVEAGMGLAYGLRVLVCGSNHGFGTWQHHPQVTHVSTLEDAKAQLKTWQIRIHIGL